MTTELAAVRDHGAAYELHASGVVAALLDHLPAGLHDQVVLLGKSAQRRQQPVDHRTQPGRESCRDLVGVGRDHARDREAVLGGKFEVALIVARHAEVLPIRSIRHPETLGCYPNVIFAMTRGGPIDRTETLSLYTYRLLFGFLDIGLGSTAAVTMPAFSRATSAMKRVRARTAPAIGRSVLIRNNRRPSAEVTSAMNAFGPQT